MNSGSANKSSRGFTLIELLVVIAIIALMASAVMLLTGTAKIRAKDSKVIAEVHSIQLALEDFSIGNGGYPNPGVGSDGTYSWCIGANDCVIADTPIQNSTNDWAANADMFPTYSDNVDFVDVQGHHNKGYVYVSCKSGGTLCPEIPSDPSGDDIAYLIYPKANGVKSLKVGTFEEQSCSLNPQCQQGGGSDICGPQGNEDCAQYTNLDAGACNYDPDGTGEVTTMCICGHNHNDSCTKYCGNPYIGSCNFDSNGTGQAWSQACEATCGCTDSGACNYDPSAEVDNGSCENTSCGNTCNDQTACNYTEEGACDYDSCMGTCIDPDACNTGDAGLCNYDCLTFGCTDGDTPACNYDPNAFTDDGSCEYESCAICNTADACNYGEVGPCDFTSCQGPLCGDSNACNYLGTLPCEYSSCHGTTCNDPGACNYQANGECEYSSCGYCSNPVACNYLAAGDCDYSCLVTCNDPGACNNGQYGACDYSCYGTCEDVYACNYGGVGDCEYDSCGGGGGGETYGCTDSGACNYVLGATADDGSCDYSCYENPTVYGCMDSDTPACNYDGDATEDDGSCDYSCYF